jgi:hypothetical protein
VCAAVPLHLIEDQNKVFDKLIFKVTGFSRNDWFELKDEFETANTSLLNFGAKKNVFDFDVHEKKRQEKMIELIREFWFYITSIYKNI